MGKGFFRTGGTTGNRLPSFDLRANTRAGLARDRQNQAGCRRNRKVLAENGSRLFPSERLVNLESNIEKENMARLIVKTAGLDVQFIDLKLGTTRVGRSPDADFSIVHPTVSSWHCDLVLTDGGVTIRDLESTNGTFVNGEPVRETRLLAGQTVRLGDVELLVESTDVKVIIPKFICTEVPAPPVVLNDGSLLCPRHPQARATHQCTHCKEVMCEACVHRLRRKGGKTLLMLCPICSQAVESIGGPQKPRKKSLLARVGETVKLKFTRAINLSNDGR
jgi:hypothetical protein